MTYRFALAQVGVQEKCLLNNGKQNITSLSLLVGTTVAGSCLCIYIKQRYYVSLYTD